MNISKRFNAEIETSTGEKVQFIGGKIICKGKEQTILHPDGRRVTSFAGDYKAQKWHENRVRTALVDAILEQVGTLSLFNGSFTSILQDAKELKTVQESVLAIREANFTPTSNSQYVKNETAKVNAAFNLHWGELKTRNLSDGEKAQIGVIVPELFKKMIPKTMNKKIKVEAQPVKKEHVEAGDALDELLDATFPKPKPAVVSVYEKAQIETIVKALRNFKLTDEELALVRDRIIETKNILLYVEFLVYLKTHKIDRSNFITLGLINAMPEAFGEIDVIEVEDINEDVELTGATVEKFGDQLSRIKAASFLQYRLTHEKLSLEDVLALDLKMITKKTADLIIDKFPLIARLAEAVK